MNLKGQILLPNAKYDMLWECGYYIDEYSL